MSNVFLKQSRQARSKLFYITILVIVLIAAAAAVASYELYLKSQRIEAGVFYKASTTDYAPTNETDVYLVSWIGCPNGAVYSWSLYMALEHYGQFTNYTMHYSDPNDSPNAIPGLIFSTFSPNSTVKFYPVYMYNEYMNETTTGITLNSSDTVQLGMDVVKSQAPSWIYSIVNKYVVQDPSVKLSNGRVVSMAYGDQQAPHVVTNLIISGAKGTWIVAGAIYPSSDIASFTPSQIMSYIESGQVQQQVPEANAWANTFASVISGAS